MRKIALLLLTLIASNSYSQEFIKLPNAKRNDPTVVFNSKIIGTLQILDALDRNKIKNLTVFRNDSKPNELINHFKNLSEYGLTSIKIDKEIKSKKQAELNLFFGFKSNNPIYIDGYLIQNPDCEIAVKSIIEIEKVVPNSSNKLKTEVLNIWTLNKSARIEK